MRVSALVFACYEKSCAPPPAGKGGSSRKRGGRGVAQHVRDEAAADAYRGGRNRYANGDWMRGMRPGVVAPKGPEKKPS